MKDNCAECFYYREENGTCYKKKVSTFGYGYVTLFDRLYCKPYTKSQYDHDIEILKHVCGDD